MSGSIRLSKKHGVNPSMGVCFFCNKENGEIMLPGRLPKDQEAPRRAVWHKQPCAECKAWMEKGVIFISVKDGDINRDNPYRTGAWCAIKNEAVMRMPINADALAGIMRSRVCFIEDKAWEALGLPRESAIATAGEA